MNIMNTTESKTISEINRIDLNIWFVADVTRENANKLIRLIKEAETLVLTEVETAKKISTGDLKFCKIDIVKNPIILYLTTNGGFVDAAWSIVDTILRSDIEIHTVISGFVASAGTLISIAGHKRFIEPHAITLLHEVRGSTWGKFTDLQERMGNIDKCMNRLVKYYIERTKLTDETTLREQLRKDIEWA